MANIKPKEPDYSDVAAKTTSNFKSLRSNVEAMIERMESLEFTKSQVDLVRWALKMRTREYQHGISTIRKKAQIQLNNKQQQD